MTVYIHKYIYVYCVNFFKSTHTSGNIKIQVPENWHRSFYDTVGRVDVNLEPAKEP